MDKMIVDSNSIVEIGGFTTLLHVAKNVEKLLLFVNPSQMPSYHGPIARFIDQAEVKHAPLDPMNWIPCNMDLLCVQKQESRTLEILERCEPFVKKYIVAEISKQLLDTFLEKFPDWQVCQEGAGIFGLCRKNINFVA